MHDGWVIGNEVVAILAVLGDDRVSDLPGGVCPVTRTVAVVDLQQALTDDVGADVADTVASLAEGGRGCGVVDPRMGEDFLNGYPCCGTGIEHS